MYGDHCAQKVDLTKEVRDGWWSNNGSSFKRKPKSNFRYSCKICSPGRLQENGTYL